MAIKIGINGMGRIGRMVVRSIFESQNKNLKIKHINNRSNSDTTCKLIKYDSIHGKFNAEIKFDKNHLIIDKNNITFSQESKIEDINWKKYDVDYVFECTGKFNSKEKLLSHIKNGAKKVIVSAPCKNADKTIVFGVNERLISKNDKIISAASCTTNCLAPVAKVLNDNYGIVGGLMTTVHAATATQMTVDGPAKNYRLGRSSLNNIIPSTTGAAIAVGKVIPELNGKLTGMAFRIPTANVSVVDLTVLLEKKTSYEDIKKKFKEASKSYLKGVLDYTEEAVVSQDYIGSTFTSNFDANAGIELTPTYFKIISWYDNEYGYSTKLVELISEIHKF